MKQLICLTLFLVSTLLVAQENQEPTLMAKVKYGDQITDVKFMLKYPFDEHRRYGNLKDIQKNFITHITAKHDNKNILNVSTSYYFTRDLLIKYKLKNIKQVDFAKYTFSDNFDTKKEFIVNMQQESITKTLGKVINSQKTDSFNFRKLKPKIWKDISVDEAIFELYGHVNKPLIDKITISGPEKTSCNKMQIHISSNVDLESFVVLNNKRTNPTIAIFTLPKSAIVDFKFNINLLISCTDYSIIVVGKDRNGNFYKTSPKGRIACGDACGGGG